MNDRVPSLVSIWSSAPFFNNNALGEFTGDPSVEGRLRAFDDAVKTLLWHERRLGKDSIWRTQNECALSLRKEFVSLPLRAAANVEGWVRTGPIPKGTPINLLANLEPDFKQLVVLKVKITKALAEIHALNLSPEAATADRNLPNRRTQTEQR